MRHYGPHRNSINTPGHAHELTFSCYQRLPMLSKPRTCEWLADAIEQARTELRFDLWAYVFMPEHVHLVVNPREAQYSTSDFLESVKQPMSRKALAFLRENAPEWIPRLQKQRGGRVETHFWLRGGGYDRNITEPSTLQKMIEYTHLNPVRRGLVEKASDWKWSSAGWYQGEEPNRLKPDHIPPEWLA
ncbi:Transposase IS200 like protein [Posidoniimonas polymericola]|uniref:Transposase IS200 like protein n=1 Tax=Posidoniimonas polymericola TaxID=2528002 RepID=A0A5C5YRZ1_9BACT|nr:transposase [Posidoniimonas polymericola]TWT77712.1 Transposase IS200 like protein [Posidoniimonas polymericola]